MNKIHGVGTLKNSLYETVSTHYNITKLTIRHYYKENYEADHVILVLITQAWVKVQIFLKILNFRNSNF